MTSNRTVSPTGHHQHGNYRQPISCPTTGDPSERKIARFCDNQGSARNSALVYLWTRPDRASNNRLTDHFQADHESENSDSLLRCERAVEALLANRGQPSRDVDRVLADDPQFVLGHCLRAAIIVRADDITARSKLVASVTMIE